MSVKSTSTKAFVRNLLCGVSVPFTGLGAADTQISGAYKRRNLQIDPLGSAAAFAFTLAFSAIGVSPAAASTCGDGSTPASTCAFAGGSFNPIDNDGEVGAAIVNGGETVTLQDVGANIASGDQGALITTLNNPLAYGPGADLPSLTTGNKTNSVASPDPISGGVVTVATYSSAALVQGNVGATPVTVPVPTVDNQYIDARFGTVQGAAGGGTLVVDIGDNSTDTLSAANNILMRSKATTLTLAQGANSAVEWASTNTVRMDMASSLAQGAGLGTIQLPVATFGGTFTAFDGSSWTVTNATELKTYNDFLIVSLQSGAIHSQTEYDTAFAKGVTVSPQTFNWTTPLSASDDSYVAQGVQFIIEADGVGATGAVVAGGQLDHRLHGNIGGAALHAINGGHVEVEAGGKLSGHYVSMRLDAAGGPITTATNNGVISGGYFSGQDWDTSTGAIYPGFTSYVEAQTILLNGASTRFDNNGIINVAGRTFASGGVDYGIQIIAGSATNAGIINVGVNPGALSGTIDGVLVASNGSFTNEASGQIYIGRAAQYDVSDLTATGADVANNVAQYGVNLSVGQAVNLGNITIGTLTQNAAALYTTGTGGGAASSLINVGSIDINGAASGLPLQNIGISATNSGLATVRNEGEITLSGVNGVGVKALSTAGVATTVSLSDTSVINVAGGADPTSGTRNFGVWAEGAGAATANADVRGQLNLTGVGAIGVHARGRSNVQVSASAAPSFLSGSDQIGFFIHGPDAVVTAEATTMDVATERSTLFRIAEGADFDASGATLTASGADSVALLGTGVGTDIQTQDGTFNLTGEGATAVVIEGGATGTILPVTTISLNAANTIAGVVDGQKHDLLGAAVGAPDAATLLTNAANIGSSQTGATGFIARNLGMLSTTGDMALSGAGSTGISTQAGGKVTVNGSTIDVNGWATKAQGAANSFALTNATVTGTDGVLDVSDAGSVTFSAATSTLTGRIRTAVGSLSDVSLTAGTQWNMTADSNVTTLANNASTIAFAPPVAGAFKTLTVDGNYTGTGGVIELNTYLGGDGSPSDLLRVNGSTAGSTQLRVINAGGSGAPTPGDGIKVVDVAVAANSATDAFTLGNRVVGGAYEYNLFRSGVSNADGDWYLRSQAVDTNGDPDPTDPDPADSNPGAGDNPERRLYRPEAAVYLANQYAATAMFTQTLQERLGEPQFIELGKKTDIDGNSAVRNSVWARIVGNDRNVDNGRNAPFSADSQDWLLQGGADLIQWGDVQNGDDRLNIGFMAGYGSSSTTGHAVDNAYRAKGEANGYSWGGYATWYDNKPDDAGLYVDLWSQHAQMRNKVNGDGLPEERYGSSIWSSSVEIGYAFKIDRDQADGDQTAIAEKLMIEPQTQFVYTRYRQDPFVERTGTSIAAKGDGMWASRLGVRAHKSKLYDDSKDWRRIQTAVELNWWHDFDRQFVAFDGQALDLGIPRDRFEVGVAANVAVSDGFGFWANAEYQFGRRFSGVEVLAGGKLTF